MPRRGCCDGQWRRLFVKGLSKRHPAVIATDLVMVVGMAAAAAVVVEAEEEAEKILLPPAQEAQVATGEMGGVLRR
jgi:hypothetical protein